jgi:glycine betaine/choline ABC-type transport system substrate-binding protein
VNKDSLDADVKETLNTATKDLTTETQRKLNAKVTIDGKDARTVAEDFLKEKGHI